MINNDRIIPSTAIDLMSLYGLMLRIASVTVNAVNAITADGQFEVDSAATALIASEPVSKLNFGADVTSATVYFVPAYDYDGFSVNGTKVDTEGADVEADGKTLYTATLATGVVTIAKVGF